MTGALGTHRPWKLVAPWYRWQRQVLEERSARSPRETRPTLQKFDRPDFVKGFLSDPQRSLKFKEAIDQIFTPQAIASPLLSSGALSGKAATLYSPRNGGDGPQAVSLLPSGMRKIFLDTHRRYYLVVCELHCDAAGFPSGNLKDVCQAGFVVRRRYLKYPASASGDALAILKRIVSVQMQLAELDQKTPLKVAQAKKRAAMVQRLVSSGEFAPRRASLVSALAALRDELQTWRDDNGVESIHEGWVPSAFDKIGAWQVVEEKPAELLEATFPLYKLHQNPDIPNHDALGRAIFFGVLPTSSLDTDERGQARLDSDHVYELRCFVRRHKPECPATENVPDCHGEVFWSEPTEAYRLAAQFDLVGTANRPFTIKMPDLRELAAQAAGLPFGKFSPMRIIQPQTLTPKTDGKVCTSGTFGSVGATCFFAIPLITIIAYFVLQLFLPIVVFLFGLWFLLAFKFCIPPSLTINTALQAELDAVGKFGLDIDADISVSMKAQIEAEPGVVPPVSTAQLNLALRTELAAGFEEKTGLSASKIDLTPLANSPLLTLHRAFADEQALPSSADAVGPDLMDGLEYEVRVETPMVVT